MIVIDSYVHNHDGNVIFYTCQPTMLRSIIQRRHGVMSLERGM